MEFDSNNLPFLRLPSPNSNIIIATPLYSDGDAIIPMLNDPNLYNNLAGPPYPYGRKEWDEWFPLIEKESQHAMNEIKEVEQSRKNGKLDGKPYVEVGAPVSAIREIDPVTGKQKYIGTIGVHKKPTLFSPGEVEVSTFDEKGNEMDAENSWELGFFLDPSFHGRGIMTATIHAMITKFIIPYMNVSILTASYFEHNNASRKVLEKNDFKLWKTATQELQETKTGAKGKMSKIGIMRWAGSA